MSDQLWKYLPHVPQVTKKSIILKRKSQVTDKQVLNLTGGLFPLKLVDPSKNMFSQIEKLDHWVMVPIVQKNTKIGPIYHWTKQTQEKKLYHGEKFNVETDIVSFNQEEFNQLPFKIPGLTFQKAARIFQLLQRFNLNFVVLHDRLQFSEYNIEDLKQIYFLISRQILMRRGKTDHPLANYIFDKKYQSNRKYQLQKYLMRNKIDTQKQKNLIAEIRRLEILIKKQQREQINLKKALKLDQAPDDLFQLQKITNQDQMRVNQKVYTRQQYLSRPLQLPGKVGQRLAEVMHGMNIPQKIIATQENVELYDKLRQKILLMFSIQRYIRKKENQRRILQDKKKKLATQQQEDKNKYISKIATDRPKKMNKQ